MNKIKFIILSFLGYRIVKSLKRLLGKGSFSEVDLVYEYSRLVDLPKLMLDVGAHFGESSMFFLKKNWKVIAFEPDSENRKEIVSNRNMIVESCALSNKQTDDAHFFGSKDSSGISSLLNFSDTHELKDTVQVRTLDFIVEKHVIKEIGFLKIDTEGYDLRVLEGLNFDQLKPEIVLCEFENNKTRKIGYTYEDLGNFLVDRGYIVYLSEWHPIVRYGTSHRWKMIEKYPLKIDESAWGNFIAIKPEHEQKFSGLLKSYSKNHS